MNAAIEFLHSTKSQIRHWSWFKKLLWTISVLTFMTSSFLFLTPPGGSFREFLAETVISTQHRDWAWIFVGAEQRDYMVRKLQASYDLAAEEKQDIGLIKHTSKTKFNRSIDDLIKVEDISGTFWKGKKMYVYDPTTIKIMTPAKAGEGERITSMVQRTGAVAGVNAGGFVDPDGLGNGFAPIGPIISGGEVIYTDQDGSVPQHIVGFTKEGTLIIGKYDVFQLRELGVSEAAMFYPRVIANGKPLITSGDGGWGRGPRTAVGQKADGTVIFIVIDGRQAHSVGATLKEVMDLFLEEDVINAGFLDGGASSELVVNGELVTKPSSRYGERRLPSAFLVYDHPEDVKANRVWDGLNKIDPGGAYDHPDFLKEQAQKRNAPAVKTEPVTPAPAKTEPARTETPKGADSGSGTGGGAKTTEPGGTAKPHTGGADTKAGEPAGAATKPAAGGGTTAPSGQPPAAGSGGSSGTPAGSGTGGGTTAPATGGSGAAAPGGQQGTVPAAGSGAGSSGAATGGTPGTGSGAVQPTPIGPIGPGSPPATTAPAPAQSQPPAATTPAAPAGQTQTQTQTQTKNAP